MPTPSKHPSGLPSVCLALYDPEPKRYSFALKKDEAQQIMACTFTAEIDGTFRDFSLVDEKLRWQQ